MTKTQIPAQKILAAWHNGVPTLSFHDHFFYFEVVVVPKCDYN
jgi:hypothetical protein